MRKHVIQDVLDHESLNSFATERLWQKTKVNGQPPSGRSCPSWATHDDCIYMLGGYDGVHRMNDFHQFRMASRTWFPIRSNGRAPTPRYFHACVVFGNSLYMFGGYSGSERLNDLFEYRFDIQTWFQVCAENPPGGRSSLVAHVYNSSLYIFGGYNGSVVLNDFFEFRTNIYFFNFCVTFKNGFKPTFFIFPRTFFSL